jgi:hypothetical protein
VPEHDLLDRPPVGDDEVTSSTHTLRPRQPHVGIGDEALERARSFDSELEGAAGPLILS